MVDACPMGPGIGVRAPGYQQMGPGIGVPTDSPGIGVLTSSRRPSYTSVFTISSVSSVDSSIYLMDTLQGRAHERKLKMILLW